MPAVISVAIGAIEPILHSRINRPICNCHSAIAVYLAAHANRIAGTKLATWSAHHNIERFYYGCNLMINCNYCVYVRSRCEGGNSDFNSPPNGVWQICCIRYYSIIIFALHFIVGHLHYLKLSYDNRWRCFSTALVMFFFSFMEIKLKYSIVWLRSFILSHLAGLNNLYIFIIIICFQVSIYCRRWAISGKPFFHNHIKAYIVQTKNQKNKINRKITSDGTIEMKCCLGHRSIN